MEKKESMKAELTVLVGQGETTCHEERKRTNTDLEFSLWCSVSVLTYLFAGFIFTDVCMVWDPFQSPPQNGAHNFHLSLHFSCLYLIMSESELNFKPELSPSFHRVLEGGHMFLVVPHLGRRFGTSKFFLIIFIIIVFQLWLAELQQVLWPDSLKSAGYPKDSLSFLVFSSLSLLFQKFTSCRSIISHLRWKSNHIAFSKKWVYAARKRVRWAATLPATAHEAHGPGSAPEPHSR